MISRQWQGLAKPSHADKYVEHLRQETFPKLKEIPGFVSASILRRSIPNGVEFLIVTTWESIDAIQGFAGTDVETAVVPPRVQEMMVEYDNRVRHYQIVQGTTLRQALWGLSLIVWVLAAQRPPLLWSGQPAASLSLTLMSNVNLAVKPENIKATFDTAKTGSSGLGSMALRGGSGSNARGATYAGIA